MSQSNLPLRALAVIALVLVAPACTTTDASRPDDSNGTAVAGRPPVAVTTVAAAVSDYRDTVEVVGSLAPKYATDIKSELSGIVTAVHVTEWVAVRKGSPLANLDPTETDAAVDALKAVEAQARVAESRARREHERAVRLKEYGLITPQAFDEATSALEAAEAATTAAHAQVRTAEARRAKLAILAPMDGVVALRNVNVGDRVENIGSGEPMFRIVDNRLLDLTVTVPTSRLPALAVGQPIEFATDAVAGRTFTGTVMFINPAVDPTSRSARVICEVPNRDGLLKGGLFVNGRIVVATRSGVLLVPREALINWDVARRSADLFTVRNGQAEKRSVRTGVATTDSVEIASGLSPGEPVVTRGGFALRPGDRVLVP